MAYKIHITQNADAAGAYFSDLSLADINAALAQTVVGVGGTIVQQTDKTTGVTLSTATGLITLNNASLNAATIVAFTLTNTLIASTDILVIEHVSGGTGGAYTINAFPGTGSAVISVRNNTAGSLGEAIALRFTIIKSANS